MPIQYTNQNPCGTTTPICPDLLGCPPGVCPSFSIRRHDTKPDFRVSIEDCDGPIDLTGLVLEANMWLLAKLKRSLDTQATYFALADSIGFSQINVGDVIIMDRTRSPEHLLVEGFDENNQLVLVQRGYHGTTPGVWKKGQLMRIFRILNAPGITEMSYVDEDQVDGTVLRNQLSDSRFVYEWGPGDTCLPGCFWMEFKLIKMRGDSLFLPGGSWMGSRNLDGLLEFTGSMKSTSSVLLSLDPRTGKFLLPVSTIWGGPVHQWNDGNYYTGTNHDDGSVYLDTTGISSVGDVTYDSGLSGISVDLGNAISAITIPALDQVSVISAGVVSTAPISFTNTPLTCSANAGIEWMRRYPLTGEGFLVKIEDSPTVEYTAVGTQVPEGPNPTIPLNPSGVTPFLYFGSFPSTQISGQQLALFESLAIPGSTVYETCVCMAGGYKYIAIPITVPPATGFRSSTLTQGSQIVNNDYAVMMATPIEGAIYNNLENGYYFALTLVNGLIYRVYRTRYVIEEAISILVY